MVQDGDFNMWGVMRIVVIIFIVHIISMYSLHGIFGYKGENSKDKTENENKKHSLEKEITKLETDPREHMHPCRDLALWTYTLVDVT